MILKSEIEGLSFELLMHLRNLARGLRRVPEEKWDWTFAVAAPTPRIIAVHTLAWLQCDRQHINKPDFSTHVPTPKPPSESEAICDALEAEANEWEKLLSNLKSEEMDREGTQFSRPDWTINTRGFILHMLQNVIYKHGQFSTLYFGLGLDGEEPYSAPFPNENYREYLGL